ncbi:MAG: hypothetical protein U0575_15115 [Phycisphaerales bacterium]
MPHEIKGTGVAAFVTLHPDHRAADDERAPAQGPPARARGPRDRRPSRNPT